MASLFFLPKVVSLPGSKLYFYRTGTSTPQDVYTDEALTVAHANPVVADGSGVFAPIYLDPTLPHYRLTHQTSADVLIYTVDDVPSNQNVQQSMRLESINPFLFLYDSDGTSGSRKYRIRAAGAAFEVQASNEAETVFTTILRYENGILYSNETEVAVTKSGSFTGTLTGMSGTVTGTVNYRLVNNIATLWIDAEISGTSNTSAMTMTGIPSVVRPTEARPVHTHAIDNSSTISCWASVSTLGVLSVTPHSSSGSLVTANGAFTASGTKGLVAGWSISYIIT